VVDLTAFSTQTVHFSHYHKPYKSTLLIS